MVVAGLPCKSCVRLMLLRMMISGDESLALALSVEMVRASERASHGRSSIDGFNQRGMTKKDNEQ